MHWTPKLNFEPINFWCSSKQVLMIHRDKQGLWPAASQFLHRIKFSVARNEKRSIVIIVKRVTTNARRPSGCGRASRTCVPAGTRARVPCQPNIDSMPFPRHRGARTNSPKVGQIGVALWLPRTMALPAPTLSLSRWSVAPTTRTWWSCLRRCTTSSPSRVPRRFPRPASRMRALPRSCTRLSWSVATAWAPRTLWPLACPKSRPRRKRLRSLAWRARWACSPSAWTVRPSPTRSRRCPSWARR